jgi:hypothetical protein
MNGSAGAGVTAKELENAPFWVPLSPTRSRRIIIMGFKY